MRTIREQELQGPNYEEHKLHEEGRTARREKMWKDESKWWTAKWKYVTKKKFKDKEGLEHADEKRSVCKNNSEKVNTWR